MKSELVIGTHNRKKGAELAEMLFPWGVAVVTLADLPDAMEVVENGDTFAANAALKATQQARHLNRWVLADDSGLEVDALGGAPGVYSARFAELSPRPAPVMDRERGDDFVSVSGEVPGKGLRPGTRNKPLIDPELRDFARKLRQLQPDAEKLMWGLLRDRRLGGYKFRRQHPIAPYVLDFYCHEIKLAVELDGGQHNTEVGLRRDQERSDFLAKLGIRVLRYWNHAVLQDTENVLESIFQGLTSHTQTPSPGPSPGPGEGDQDDANNCELLCQLADTPLEKRTARYVCHVTLADPNGEICAESRDVCHGRICFEPAGRNGFGYDPLFEVIEYHRTFGELGPSVKRAISHRSRAMRAILPELRKVVGTLRVS